jgi:hypothetical protein
MPRLNATWTATGGGAALTGYELRVSSSGGSTWGTFTSPNGASTFMVIQLPAGHSYLVEVRAHNSADAWSDWSAPATFMLSMAEGESGAGYQKVGSWKSGALSGASGGSVTYSSTSGNIIRYTFTGRSVALVSTFGPNRGIVDVYVDGWRATTLNLYSATLTTRHVVFVQNWASSGTHMISLQLRSSTRVDVDACVVLN